MILEILEEFGAKATFFICGRKGEKYPEILRAIVERGHRVGNHTYSHSRFLTYMGILRGEIERTERIIYEITSHNTRLFRPPWGIAQPWLKRYLKKRGYQLVLWDIDTEDWKGISGEVIAKRIEANIKDNAIILLHDGDSAREKKQNTLSALQIILPFFQEEGFSFQAL